MRDEGREKEGRTRSVTGELGVCSVTLNLLLIALYMWSIYDIEKNEKKIVFYNALRKHNFIFNASIEAPGVRCPENPILSFFDNISHQ
jgi:hypothetical protein